MRQRLSYIISLALLVASCTSDEIENTLSGDGIKTPIAVKTTIDSRLTSRAYDKTFEENDQLFAYIEAGKLAEGAFTYEDQFHWAGNFTMGETVDNGGTPEGTGLITSSDKLSPTLYWDDFSSVDYDLRDTEVERGIRLKYGYCFNGGTPINDSFNETDGTLKWAVQTNQSADPEAMQHSDLLYAATTKYEDIAKYTHEDGTRGVLTLPYTHAMSKITIIVNTGEGFDTNDPNFSDAVLTLKDMQTVATVDAPSATVTPSIDATDIKDITTFTKSKNNVTATYQAIVGPTNLSAGNILAHISNVHGNSYDIPITTAMLEAWSTGSKLISSFEEIQNGVAQAKGSRAEDIPYGKGYTTKQGIHYILDVTVNKQKIIIRATITDWESVKAEGKAAINFTSDVTEKGTIAEALKTSGFDVYKSSNPSAFSQKSTTVTFADNKWNYMPAIYWQNQSDNSYFRAVSPAGASTSELTQGIDLMWGTSGNDAIAPRTGDVPLDFQHLMSKLCVKLETSSDAAMVNLEEAKIKITNMATAGEYNLADATVSAASPVEIMLSDKLSGFTEYVVPQNIGNDAKLIVTLADGTTYSLQLNQCVLTDTETAVTAWTSGKSYTYTIHLEKEKITFRALIKEWDEATGSGNATLEWD